MKFAKIIFWLAGIWGILMLTPLYFMFQKIGRVHPPIITHPEYYYGFIGVAIAWQLAFFVISTDPARLRPIMIPAIFEKCSFAAATFVLGAQGRVPQETLVFGGIDLLFAVLFLLAFFKTKAPSRNPATI
jgi:hypothetical protein